MKTDERPSTLETLVPDLGIAYREWKGWEAAKEALKKEFFELADEAVGARGLAVKMIDMPAQDEQDARERVERHYPAWKIQELRLKRSNEVNMWEAVLIEDPSLKTFSYEHDGVKFGRTISRGSVMIDDEWLKVADPELYEQVTYPLPWGDRITVPIEMLETATLGRLTRYIYNSRPRASLAAPRAVKDES